MLPVMSVEWPTREIVLADPIDPCDAGVSGGGSAALYAGRKLSRSADGWAARPSLRSGSCHASSGV